jgi:hypothetical protein
MRRSLKLPTRGKDGVTIVDYSSAERGPALSILLIIIIVIVVLALLGFFGRGRMRR